ncbi:MAG: CRISPR-associated protein Cas4 [Deltaproteobacteria bacterium]|nr:CRISPR-associated protein Cas4 [Deltaproteobacteria bacterium]
MYDEEDLLPISALQHILYCERQCALIHIERMWHENRFTAEGRIMHDRAHHADSESRGNIRLEFGVPLRSLRLGLIGQADEVEYHKVTNYRNTVVKWLPFPVEYKRGKAKQENWDRVQLCAQALCLEEMLEIDIPAGALFYGRQRRRQNVIFDLSLRDETEAATRYLHTFVGARKTPVALFTKRCERCSFLDICLPRSVGRQKSARGYLKTIMSKK